MRRRDDDSTPALHLRLGGTSVVLDVPRGALPGIVYWGPDLGDISEEALVDAICDGRATEAAGIAREHVKIDLELLERVLHRRD